MPRKSIPAIPVGVLRIHGAHSVFRLFRIFNYFFSRAISPSPAGISRALSQSVPISIFHFAVFPRLEEQQRDFVAHKTRPLPRRCGTARGESVSPKPAEIRPDPRSRSESPPPTANPVIPPAHRKPFARPPLSVRRASLSRSAATPPASPAAPNSRRQRTARNLRRQKARPFRAPPRCLRPLRAG